MKLIKIAILPVIIGIGLIVGGALNKPAKGEFDVPGLNTQVQNQQKELDNHEVRITNSEADIQQLQTHTETAPAPHQAVPAATPAPQPEPVPTPSPTPSVEPAGPPNHVDSTTCGDDQGSKPCRS